MIATRLHGSTLSIGEYFSISFQRTLRIPDDGCTYPLPPSFGEFPLHRVEDFKSGVPSKWVEEGGIFLPMYQREALWLNFIGHASVPTAVKIGIGKVNALTGKRWDEPLHTSPQDYLVCPNQPWLDGINAGKGLIRQFVAVPLGQGLSVEGQITGKEDTGGMQVLVYHPRKDVIEKILDGNRRDRRSPGKDLMYCCMVSEMGLGAGGRMKQSIYLDDRPVDYWDQSERGRMFVHIVNSEDYKQITGKNPPPTPIDARAYMSAGLPWFDLYDAEKDAISGTEELDRVKSVPEPDELKPGLPIITLHPKNTTVADGSW